MIVKLSNGKEIEIADAVKNSRAEAIEWLRERKERNMKPSIEEMSAEQCYAELDRLTLYRQINGRGRNPDAYAARHYCDVMKAKVKRRLKQLGARATRPGDGRTYGPGQAAWQRAGGAP